MFRNTYATVGQNQGRVRLRIADCGSRICRFPIRNPKSEIRNRLGITLTEVLISLGILTIGLLGVAALFPVGSYYMQRGEVADHGSALAQAAFNDVVARGVLNASSWLAWEDPAGVSSVPTPRDVRGSTFARRWADMLAKKVAESASKNPRLRAWELNVEFGSVICIDPRGVASVALPNNGGYTLMKFGGKFPSASPAIYSSAAEWGPWAGSAATELRWPIRRVTLGQSSSAPPYYMPMDAVSADRLFTSSDDLALELPPQQDRPAIQRWELGNLDGGGVADDPLARQSRGDYSWAVTVAPTTPEARDALATDPSAHYYEVSVVVFYKRVLPTPPQNSSDVLSNVYSVADNERAVRARIVSTGLSGGEVLLTRFAPVESSTEIEPGESPYANLKTGNWVLLCGPHPSSTGERPMIVARWYRVLSIEDEAGGVVTDPANQRLVALRGPQWPWQPEPSGDLTVDSHLSNALYVCIPTGAVAVHAKTIRLEGNSVWSGGAVGIGGSGSPGTPMSVGS